jgi:hypothetical protein
MKGGATNPLFEDGREHALVLVVNIMITVLQKGELSFSTKEGKLCPDATNLRSLSLCHKFLMVLLVLPTKPETSLEECEVNCPTRRRVVKITEAKPRKWTKQRTTPEI